MAEKILTRKAIAYELGVSERTVSRHFKEGRLPGAFKLGGGTSPIRMREADLKKISSDSRSKR
ncbi:helix-turn-helix transcriptional regulator [Martelella radicis]|uniref:Putative DNA-binding transcriptional regulator AlpA n=1 Tax=Martelella radicis TaxID=1397476 RepID=A0A7W6KL14_9HYPH|nr:hypothetical protein [Martelella radicis]MBB4123273.1 putative DNA-binding transcriptional regulator AlpA [Martelella radicis]